MRFPRHATQRDTPQPRRLLAAIFFVLIANGSQTFAADSRQPSDEMKNRRCASRLAIALTGKVPQMSLLGDQDPQSKVDLMLTDEAFKEYFARFLNARFNSTPGATPSEDIVYYLAKYILQNNLPWRDLFIGPYTSDALPANSMAEPTIRRDPNGIGYFKTPSWITRYAGNESQGIRLSAAFRMMNNTLGLKVTAETLPPSADDSATGRAVEPCKSCHFDKWYALDKTASVLGRITRTNNVVSVQPYVDGPKEMLGGMMVQNEREFITQLVNSSNFLVHSCRLVFQFLYGRDENACESETFDACIETLKSEQASIVAAISGVAKDPNFCQ